MIIPSDNQLNRLGALEEIDNQGFTVYNRDYQKAFIESSDLKLVIAALEGVFAERGFPLVNLEQNLKGIQNQMALDIAEGLRPDALSAMLNVARPDIIMELTYELQSGGMTNALSYTLSAIDAYTFKTVSSVADPGVESLKSNIAQLLAEQVERTTQNLQATLKEHFADIRQNGREIKIRITAHEEGIVRFNDWSDSCDDEWLYIFGDWVKGKAKEWLNSGKTNGAFKQGISTATVYEAQFRIPLYGEDGFSIAASDIARAFRGEMRKKCGLNTRDVTQGIGEAKIVVMD
ncbi:MAG: hypothetical protein KDD19_21630 [Phaeodactylibacter sp.]|nr:hypothetical protein [Phaeodactylibacter sp.]MCB9049345.1 hypothetical protein [Lewinellaceae bacterium]